MVVGVGARVLVVLELRMPGSPQWVLGWAANTV